MTPIAPCAGADQRSAPIVSGADLSEWRSTAPLAIDPERGRLKFQADEPPHNLTVSYVEGFSGDIGAGAYERF
jgi:hypothetical protein